MGNICCESDEPRKGGVSNMKMLTSHKEPLAFENDADAFTEQVIRHTVVISDKKYKLTDFDTPYLLGKGGFATVYLA
jgi:hypothetical protein